MSLSSHEQGCLGQMIFWFLAITLSIVLIPTNCAHENSKEYKREIARQEAARKKAEADREARFQEQWKQLNEKNNVSPAQPQMTRREIYRTPSWSSGVSAKTKINQNGTITITLDARNATQWDKEKAIGRLLEDADIEDLFDYYDIESPEGY